MSGTRSWSSVADSLDLLGVALLAVAGTFPLLVEGTLPTPVRVGIGIGLILFAPGYALVSLLIPRETVVGVDGDERRVPMGERLLLAVGFSIVTVPLVGILLNYTQWGPDPESTVAAVGIVTFLLAELAIWRRLAADAPRRFRPGIAGLPKRVGSRLAADTNRETVVNVVLVAGLAVAVAGVGLAVATTDNGERYTEFYLLAENDSGELVADGYPTELSVGKPTELHVGVANREAEPVTYTVVVQLQRVERTEAGRTVTERFGVDSFRVRAGAGETVQRRHAVEPTVAGEGFRLTYLLYAGAAPSDPSTSNAYRSVHLWVDVTPAGGG
ncbi:DUF1616 domain-containing protein [Natronomonas marina]|jgi:uncharacterized membrane protein|uniref:DUF1616 domain-containing protein n=1 Tax=Natronomonas marina TaxID=2961939 RepID=UPI0020C960DF|nr:DUF1616 domain-containing protein [Natronomonas marina]